MAVALGIGAVVATGGTGLAWAESGSAGEPQNGSALSDDTTDTSADGGTDVDTNQTTPPAGGDAAAEGQDDADDRSDDQQADASSMNYSNSGGVDTSTNDLGQATDTTELADDELDDVPEDRPEGPAAPQDQGIVQSVPEPVVVQHDSDDSIQQDSKKDAIVGQEIQTFGLIDEAPLAAQHRDDAEFDGERRTPITVKVTVEQDVDDSPEGDLQRTVLLADEEPAVEPVSMSAPTGVLGIAGTFVAALLSPFLAPTPATPVEPPLLWALLAAARRDFHRTFSNSTPRAVVDAITTSEDTSATVDVVSGTDPDIAAGDVVTVLEVTQPAHGTVTVDGGMLTYTPDPDFHGTDSFTYTISDEGSPANVKGLRGLVDLLLGRDPRNTDTMTVTVTVAQVDDDPVAVDDAATLNEDSAATAIEVLGNDSDPDEGLLTVTGVGTAGNGTVSLEDGVISYAPNPDFSGTDSFTYTISAADGDTATATVVVTVEPVNDDPEAVDDAVTVDQDSGATAIDVLSNDTDVDGDELTVTGVGTAANGTVALTDGVVTYTPNAGYHGTDSFEYQVSDGNGGLTTATVDVIVKAADTIVFDDGAVPDRVFVTSDPSRIVVVTGDELRIVDPATGDVVDTVELGATPWSITMSPDRRYAYIGTTQFGTDFVPVTKIDLETGGSTPIGGVRQPTAMAISPDGGTLFVTNYQDGTVSVIDTDTGTYRVINTGYQTDAIAVSEDGATLYVGSIINDVRVVDVATGTYSVLPTGTFEGEAADQSITVVGDRAYVTDGLDDKLVVIDTSTNAIVASYDVGARPVSVTATADGAVILVANAGDGSVTVIDEELGVLGTIPVGDNPTDIEIAADMASVYVATRDGISVIPAEDISALATQAEMRGSA